LNLSLRAAEQIAAERGRLHRQWRQQLQRAQYQTQRARRQYDAVDPENRLVARELERQWEESLREERNRQEEYDRLKVQAPEQLTVVDHRRIESLATDIPALWNDPHTTAADKQAVIRCLVERVVVSAIGTSECVDVSIHWAGGFVSHHQISRPVGRYDMLRDYDRLKDRVGKLRREGKPSREIAACLNAEGFSPPRHERPFNAVMVRMLLSRLGLSGLRADSIAYAPLLGRNEWWLQDLARHLQIPRPVLNRWCVRGWVNARKVMITRSRWIIWVDADEIARLQRLRAHRRTGPARCYPATLTTPKSRADT
jgi:hypothetical protein